MRPMFKSFCFRWLPSLAAAGLLLSLLSGCQSSPSADQEPLRVGVAIYTGEDTFISTVVHDLERIAQETEMDQQVKINLSIQDGRTNQTNQLDQIDGLLDRGCDILCVNIVDRTAAAVLIDKAEKANVPLIFFNRQPVAEDIQRWEHVYYVGAQAEQSGLLQGRIVLSAWNMDQAGLDHNQDSTLQYVMLEGEPGHQDALLRTEYATKPLTDAQIPVEKLGSDTANWSRGQAAAKTRQWIQAFGDQIEVVFANNDDMALGAIDAFREAGFQELPLIVGVDGTLPALEAVAAGELQGTVLNDAEGIAQTMMDLILALHTGQPPASAVELVDGHYVWLPYQQITAKNLSNYLPQT